MSDALGADGVARARIPADADPELQRVLARFGDAGYYRIVAVTDPQVKEAIAEFDRALAILKSK